jgi:hypothetical protein
LSVSAFASRHLDFTADERQAAVLDSGAKRGILNCTRQWGKSTVAAALAVHRMWTQPGSLVLVASPTKRQSVELMRKAVEFLLRMGARVRGSGEVMLANGSRMVALPGREATVRCYSGVSILLFDEAARLQDEVYRALRATIATSNGDVWLMSTPWGRTGFFHEVWMYGGPRWMRVSVPATECPRISAEFLEEERESLGAGWFEQEYLCEFRDQAGVWFARGVVEQALVSGEPLALAA